MDEVQMEKMADEINAIYAQAYPGGRPKERIAEILALFQRVWEGNREMRFGQMLIAVAGQLDIFNVEDDKWKALLLRWIERQEQAREETP